MGYDLGIRTANGGYFDGHKLFGYIDDIGGLESYEYLKSINQWEEMPYFDDGSYNEITLTEQEFNAFVDLYLKDYLYFWSSVKFKFVQATYKENYKKLCDELNKAKNIKGDKILHWW